LSEARRTGVISLKTLQRYGYIPPAERLRRGPVAIFECVEEIPCNICVNACPLKAVSMSSIVSMPVIDFSRCIGCAVCVGKCPGQAVFVVDLSKEDSEYVTLPYEMSPPPKKGAVVKLLNREGVVVGRGEVVKFFIDNGTYVVTVRVPKGLALNVRAIRVS